ncbi:MULTISPECIES: hypothetical protein [Actinoplanes]|uniref:hypothetical protein n=1 Tax=Actinoplanes TaxID=1865 RepID=UPI0005F28093|nr:MULTISPECIES: hypothetical protein [Actinoplanes]GLY00799.1 hypothetical protein Acsp01_11780 [Actinoplanes sp. NBRC 101535]
MAPAVFGGLIGLALAALGARMLLGGRVPALITRAFATSWEGGCYHLLMGVAVMILMVGALLPAGQSRTSLALLAIVLVMVALVRFRPHR